MNKKNCYFTSDTHFGHANIIKYCNRPFSNVREMDEILIKNWNEKVPYDAIVYHLGDFAFGRTYEDVEKYRSRLNGKIHLIKGNHDNGKLLMRNAFESVNWNSMQEIFIGNKSITLNHYAMKVWNKSHRGAWHLYGHSHGTLPDDPNSLSFDVGVDCHNYYPLSFLEVENIMNNKNFKAIDHHGRS